MKKIILLSIALILAGFLSALEQNNVSKDIKSGQDRWEPDTVYVFFNGIGGETAKVVRYIYEYQYHSQELLVERIEQWPRNDSWVNGYLYTFTYDFNNNFLNESRKKWENNTWVNLDLHAFSYTYTYDSNNNMLIKLSQLSSNNSWKNSFLSTYTYDSNNNKLTELQQDWSNNSWENSLLSTYTYDSNNNMLTELQQNWSNNSWVDGGLSTYTYDSNNNMLTELQQIWSNNSWVNYKQYLRSYDENGNGISVESFNWIDESWQPSRVGGSTMVSLWLYYNNMQSLFEMWGCDKITASYKKVPDFTSIAKPPTTPESNTISIYPNPTTGKLKIDNGQLKIKNVELFDIYGKKILNFQFSIFNSLDVSHLPAGIYFVQVTSDKGIVTKKIVKL